MTHRAIPASGVRQQLRQVVDAVGTGMVVIEPDGVLSWANARALAMHGAAAQDDLGADLAAYAERFDLRYRNGRRLDPVDYPAARALRGERIEDVVVHVARRGDEPSWTHKVGSIQVLADGGGVDFLVLVLEDDTDAFNAERRFERVFAANPAPAVICRLEDQRFIKVNVGFLELTGHRRDGVIGKSLYELDVLERAERRETAVRQLEAGATIPQMEADLTLPGGGSRLVIVAGHPIEVDGADCMLFTFIDLEPRRKAEAALRQSEERFSCAFQLSPVPMVIGTLAERRIIDANEAFLETFGHSRSAAIGRTKVELEMWKDLEARGVLERQLQETGTIPTTTVRLHAEDGRALDCLLTSRGVTIGGEPCVLTVLQDVSDRTRSDEQLLAAVESVVNDASWLGQKIVAAVHRAAAPRSGAKVVAAEALSCRERQVAALVAQGASNQAIATELKLSVHTVKNHLRCIYGKVGVHKRTEAAIWARQEGLLNHVHERGRKTK